ncbi:MAG: molybdopterin-guanine dinucleotide biosynthesis protein A [Actinomycetales bacterium]|nr:molybdopterin-guanine dinucleotide biosynthesis protein A [Tetrasphaera sp.]NLW98602.1 molybdopterin-guanine dinucleotide biosynthesis protein A [Actinomycetales bacterium]
MTDLEHPLQEWVDWVKDASEAVGVDPTDVDISRLHYLSKQVAHRLQRPLAPVSTFILGLALGSRRGELDAEDALDRILRTLPSENDAD